MTRFSLAPAFIKLKYGDAPSIHVATYPTKFSGTPNPGSAPNLESHSGGVVGFTTAMEAWVDLLKVIFNTGVSFIDAEVWSQPTAEDDPVWIYTHTLGVAGTSASATTVALEDVTSFRTNLGHPFRLYLMETIGTPNTVQSPGGFDTAHADIVTFVTGINSWLWGRDNGYPISALSVKTKYNDVLRRKLLTG